MDFAGAAERRVCKYYPGAELRAVAVTTRRAGCSEHMIASPHLSHFTRTLGPLLSAWHWLC